MIPLKLIAIITRLKEKLNDQLMDDFIAALEQLNSPELVWKV